jgi:hypothetical protein
MRKRGLRYVARSSARSAICSVPLRGQSAARCAVEVMHLQCVLDGQRIVVAAFVFPAGYQRARGKF